VHGPKGSCALPWPYWKIPNNAPMERKGYYSPPLRRQVVSRMYHEAKSRGLSMVCLNDMIVEDGLNRLQKRAEGKIEAKQAA
jgi:hypothetical protein